MTDTAPMGRVPDKDEEHRPVSQAACETRRTTIIRRVEAVETEMERRLTEMERRMDRWSRELHAEVQEIRRAVNELKGAYRDTVRDLEKRLTELAEELTSIATKQAEDETLRRGIEIGRQQARDEAREASEVVARQSQRRTRAVGALLGSGAVGTGYGVFELIKALLGG